jgi:hypothetical protein
MSIRSWFAAYPRKALIGQVIGFCIFVTAFFLPAVRAGSVGSDSFYGWDCARMALQATPHLFEKPDPDWPYFMTLLLAMSGWINILILLYVSFSFAPKFLTARRILAAAILVCMVSTWTFFVVEGIFPLIGHFLWIGGALLILAPEVSLLKRKTSTEKRQIPLVS